MKTPKEILLTIANNEKARRKSAGFTQQELALRADVSLPSLRRFEQKGEISLSSLVKIATVLDDQDSFLSLFPEKKYTSMEELLNAKRKQS